MKSAIYGASLSGYFATKLIEFQNNELLYYIDIEPKNKHIGIRNMVPVYKNINLIPDELKEDTELIIVALGNKELADEIKKKLLDEFNCIIYTIHEEPYKEFYELLIFEGKKNLYLEEKGYFKSLMLKQSIDKNGSPIPWISYPLFDFLKDRVKADFSVFEWGTGNSTLWWSRNVKRVTAVEHDREWFEYVSSKVESHVKVIFKTLEYGGEYSKVINSFENIDIVIIDGRDRVNCALQAVNSLSDTGVIIWDDTERLYYKEGFEYLKSMGFKVLTFTGIKGIEDRPAHSSIFYRKRNCLNI